MSDLNICFCGAQDGYPHDRFCPRPLFRGTPEQQAQWLHEYSQAKRDFALNHDVEEEFDEPTLDLILQELHEALTEDLDLEEEEE